MSTSVQARNNLDAHVAAENQAVNAELQARLNVRMALEQAYGKLRAAFPGQRAFVESFFLKRKRSDDSKKPDVDSGRNPA